MYKYEKKYNKYHYIAGFDEAGRGSWAGPIVAACCILPKKYKNNNINDSKQLSKKKRNELFEVIIHDAIDYSIAFVSASDVDKLNPKQASIKAMEQALKKMKIVPNICLIDAERINTQIKQENIIKGDCLSISIAAASILAKVARDKYMEKLHINFPQYNFSSNMGYGTNEHWKAIKKFGIINEHRKTYKPIRYIITKSNNTIKTNV